MCWNPKVSLNTFLFSLFGVSFAYFNNTIGLFELLYFLSFISMQLLEYFTWKYLNDKKMNTVLSQIGLSLIFIQIPLFILSYYAAGYKFKALLIIIYLIFALFCLLYFKIDYSMNKASNGHLAWNWLNFPTVVIFIWLSFIFGVFLYQKQYFQFGIYSLIVISIYYTYYKTNTWGSLWCWFANILSLKLILQVFLSSNSAKNCLLYDNNTCIK